MAFNSSEKHAFEQVFASISGNLKTVDVGQLGSLCTKAGFSLLQIQNQLSSQNNDLTHVSFNDFFIAASFLKGAASSRDKITLHGHNENITHTINEDEKHGFVSHINSQLHGDKQLKCLPINPDSMVLISNLANF